MSKHKKIVSFIQNFQFLYQIRSKPKLEIFSSILAKFSSITEIGLPEKNTLRVDNYRYS